MFLSLHGRVVKIPLLPQGSKDSWRFGTKGALYPRFCEVPRSRGRSTLKRTLLRVPASVPRQRLHGCLLSLLTASDIRRWHPRRHLLQTLVDRYSSLLLIKYRSSTRCAYHNLAICQFEISAFSTNMDSFHFDFVHLRRKTNSKICAA